MPLSPKNRRHLKSLAHPLEPLVRVGKAGVSERVIAETDRTIESHELIKVRFDADDPTARKAMAADLAAATTAELVTTVGKIAILYRPRREKPKIKLPDEGTAGSSS